MPEVSSSINKSDVIQTMSHKLNIDPADAAFIVDTLTRKISEALRQGLRLEFRGFGRFEVRKRPAYQARNPKNGESISTLEKNKVHFKASTQLLARIMEKLNLKQTETT